MSLQRHFCLSEGSETEVLSCADCKSSCLTKVDTGEGVFPADMTLPIVVLAAGTIVLGVLNVVIVTKVLEPGV